MNYNEFKDQLDKLIDTPYGKEMLLAYIKEMTMNNPKLYKQFSEFMFEGIQERYNYAKFLHSECQVVASAALDMVDNPLKKKNQTWVNAITGRLNKRVLSMFPETLIQKYNEKFNIPEDKRDDKDEMYK